MTSIVRGHVGAAIAATAAVVVLGGGALVLLTSGSGTPVTTSGTTTTTVPAGQGKPGKGGGKNRTVRGKVTAIGATAWTVVTTKGVTMTVNVGPSTVFGTKKKPLSASNFAVGDDVVIMGSRNGTTVAASRIAKGPKAGKSAPGTTTTVP